jgi:C4-dicarboxylate-specific signal transduction histidine kinase
MREAATKRKAELALSKLNESLQDEVEKQTSEILKQTDIIIKQAKYAALGEMIGAIAHQWRQPLNSIALGVQEVHFVYEMQGFISKQEMDRFCTETLEQIKYMSRTIDDFRNFFKNNQKTTSIQIEPIIKKAIFLLQKQLDLNSITITINGDDFVASVIANELEQVILNIINNAKDQIIISACADRRIFINLDNIAKTISIQDFAGGILDENLDAIFHSEFSTKGERGTGLGLYMAQMIVEKHFDGTLMAYNLNGGAVFEISLRNG